jgi:hypothetical protein
MRHTSRKTIPIEALIDYANGYLAADFADGDSAADIARRAGMIDMIEHALMRAKSYGGFWYLDQNAITKSKPGIHRLEGGGHSFENTDVTRRRYV